MTDTAELIAQAREEYHHRPTNARLLMALVAALEAVEAERDRAVKEARAAVPLVNRANERAAAAEANAEGSERNADSWALKAAAAARRAVAAEAELHPTTEEGLGKLISTVRAQVELDEGGYCVLCGMHYTDPETLEHDRSRATKFEAENQRLREALDWIEAEPEDPLKVQLWARAALAGNEVRSPSETERRHPEPPERSGEFGA